MRKLDPEWHRRVEEQGRAARREMDEIIERSEARRRAREEERERRRRLWQRILTLGLKT
jgi:hypothetical protein